MSDENFTHDVFISHNSADSEAVLDLAQRLKADGLRVWFDYWEVKPGDLVSLKSEQGLEHSRTLLLVMSAAALASEWVALERHTALFRDPTNSRRRFIPLRLDDAPLPDTLKQFSHAEWRQKSPDQYAARLSACLPPDAATEPATEPEHEPASNKVLKGHERAVYGVAITAGGAFTLEQLRAVVGLLAGPGVVWKLEFGDFVLLQPERINAYAAAVIRSVRAHTDEIGCIPEERVLAGDLDYQKAENQRMERLPRDEEQIVLRAMHQILVDRGICLREHTEAGPLLVFPSYFKRERPEQPDHCQNAKCGEPVADARAVQKALEAKRKGIRCQYCDKQITLRDLIEEKFASERIRSGRKVYLQLRTTAYYEHERDADGLGVFTVKDPRHAEQWRAQDSPIMLVTRTRDGQILWVDVGELLRQSPADTRRFHFLGEPFTALSLVRMRDRMFPRTY